MAFSYTGSALNSLVDGLTNNAAPVVTCLNDVKTQFNSDTETTFSTYKQIIPSQRIRSGSLASGTTYLLDEAQNGIAATDTQAGGATFYMDPADYTAASRTNKYRLRVSLLTNATAPTSTFTFGLYPVTACAGGAGVNSITLGAVTAGSTCAFVAPTLSTLVAPVSSGDFTAPVAGYYVIGVAVTVATMVANSSIAARAILQQRQI